MRPVRLTLFICAAVLAAAAAVVPALALSESTPSIGAVNAGIYGHYWSPATAAIAQDGAVTISNATEVSHGVDWVGGPATPACSAGIPVGSGPAASGTKWTGTCAFSTAGVYTFYCTVHGSEMTGTVTVATNGATTITTPTVSVPAAAPAPPAQTVASSAPVPSLPSPSPLAGGASSALKLAAVQHGSTVRGSVALSQAGAGGRLEVQLLARPTALAAAASAAVPVGRTTRAPLHAGVVSFAAVLDGRARRALRHAHRLALRVRITLAPVSGAAVAFNRAVLLRG